MIHNIYIMYHRIGNSALETTGISAESYELAKDVAVTAAGVTAVGKLAKAGLGIGGKIASKAGLGNSLSNKTNNKTNQPSDSSQQNGSSHNNSLNSISDVNQAIEQTRSSKDNYTKKLEKNKQITLNKHL